jgi:hypothetical protein
MRYTASTRDRYRLSVTAVSGALTVTVLAASGALAGALAHEFTRDKARQQAEDRAAKLVWKRQQREVARAADTLTERLAANADKTPVVTRERRQRQRVITRYTVTQPTVGGGGTVGDGSGAGGSGGSGGSGSGGPHHSGGSGSPSPSPSPPPPPPPPPPPTSGS